jgi:ribosomal protein L7/L12
MSTRRGFRPAIPDPPGSRVVEPLPPGALAALERGQKIEAIRIVREEQGLGLREAKDLVEAHERASQRASGGAALSGAAIAALQRGDQIEAIRIIRGELRLGLKDSKEIVDEYLRAQPGLASAVAIGDRERLRRLIVRVAVLALLGLLGYLFVFGR